MAAAASGTNFVRYFFYPNNGYTALEKQSLVALAYAASRELMVAPSSILIRFAMADHQVEHDRSALHPTTSFQGKHIPDPKGWHATIAMKNKSHEAREVHISSHGYTAGQGDYRLTEAVNRREKPDDVPRGAPGSGKVVWPDEKFLEEYESSPTAYSHIAEQGESK